MPDIPEHTPASDIQLRVGLIGNPVAHSYSPRFQQAALDTLGTSARYELWQTAPDELPARQALPGRKCNHPLQRGGAAPAGHGRPAGNVYRGSKHYCPSRWIFARL